MINTYRLNGETWVDLNQPTPEEIHEIMDIYSIHPFVAKEMTTITPKPRIEFHDDYLYCILHFPAWKHTHSGDRNQEVDFIIGKNTLITARYDTIDALHKLSKDLEVREVLDKSESGENHSHVILTKMLRELYASVFEELEYISGTIQEITANIFKNKEREMVISISEITRTLLEFKRVTDLHHEILEALKKRGQEIFGNEFGHEMETIILDYLKINTTIKSNLEMLRELRDTDDSLLSAKQNQIMKQLTVMGAIVLPVSLIAWIFAMRTEGMPLIDSPHAFWIVLGIMAGVALVALLFAKYKKWL